MFDKIAENPAARATTIIILIAVGIIWWSVITLDTSSTWTEISTDWVKAGNESRAALSNSLATIFLWSGISQGVAGIAIFLASVYVLHSMLQQPEGNLITEQELVVSDKPSTLFETKPPTMEELRTILQFYPEECFFYWNGSGKLPEGSLVVFREAATLTKACTGCYERNCSVRRTPNPNLEENAGPPN